MCVILTKFGLFISTEKSFLVRRKKLLKDDVVEINFFSNSEKRLINAATIELHGLSGTLLPRSPQ